MDQQLTAAVVGAIVGALVTGLAGVATWALSELTASRRAMRATRVALAREVIKYRGDQGRVAEALNELPVVFGHDEELLRLYRLFLDGTRKDDTLLDIVVRLAKIARINDRVNASDLKQILHVSP